ncbi:MAG TPA: fibronectin type III domain-containing protein [Trebonia sp.]
MQHVSLNDGGIWVTNNSIGTVGRFTKPIGQLDGELAPPSESISVDVWQNGPVVAAYDASGGRIYAVNVYGTAFYDAGAAISPAPGGIALGDETVAVLSTDHSLRATALSAGGGSLAALSASAKPLAAHLPADSAVSVGSDDTVWLAGGGQLRSYPRGGKAQSTALPLSASDPMQVTTVGDVPVVADTTTKTIYLPDSGHTVTLPSSDTSTSFELQQPSAASGVVVAATTQALYSVDPGSGQLTTLSSGHSGSVAAPVQVAGCVHAAWANGATGSYVRTCGSPPPAVSAASPAGTVRQFSLDDTTGAPVLVFRVNNGTLVLNDTTDGGVFLIDSNVTNVRPKWTPVNTAGNSSNQAQTFQVQEKTQLTAKPYTQGVRPGTTTVVHVLDVDKGPPGTYAVSAVGQPDQPGVSVAVAPDSQTVLATVTSLPVDAHFQYTIDDGHGHTASNDVTLEPRAQGENSAPALRPGYQPPSLSVASGGTLVIPVIGDWRDSDGDPLYIDSGAVTSSAGSAAVTSGGALSFTAPQSASGETVRIGYGVSDGRVTTPTKATLTVNVLGASSTRFVAPVAEPDATQAVVGAPVTLQPLANDLPGVDPTNPSAHLTLAAPVPAVTGASVSTDMATGTVAFTAQHPGDFFLTYTDAYGAAPTASGTIRLHVIAASGTPKPPVTTPDVAVLHGQQSAVVDVLADDYDPQGWILGVTSAEPAANSDDGAGLQVAVIDQRWLRISADNPQRGMTATVDYTVSDGKGSATGTVAVSAVAGDLNADQITTTAAAVTIRSGDSAAVPVLAGDASSIGLPLTFSGVPPVAQPPVAGLISSANGTNLRVDAPAGVKSEAETTVSYVATDASGATATGQLDVTIEPPPSKTHPDQAPVPEEVDTREAAGDVAVIQVPVDGVDPDGDSVTVTGVTVPPTLGRIVAVGPDTISYQSYPNSTGTDTFTYQVTDPYGLTGTATVRIAVLPPGPPQPPVTADDVINAPPGASLHWNVLGNDFIAPGDTVTVEPLSKTNSAVPAGVTLNGSYVYLKVPGAQSDPPVQFTYADTDGGSPSLAQVIVHAVPGAKVPPIANDDVAPAPAAGAGSVTVNVLKNDDDPLGSAGDLKISWAPAGVAAHSQSLTIKLQAQPREVPYQVTAPNGLTATAVVYVPGTQSTAIRLRPGARIVLKENGSSTVPLSSVLEDTSGRQLKITTVNELSASPGGDLTVNANQASAFQVHALGSYAGPGAVTVQVYDGATMQDPHGNTATLTIPAQVGPDVPILRCPQDPIQVVEGGAPVSYDIGQLCHVWVDTTVPSPALRYSTSWTKAAGGVTASVPGGTSLQLTASSGAAPGSTGAVQVIPAGAAAGNTGGTINVVVIKAPPPTGRAVSVTVEAGHSVTVNLSQYVTSPLARPDIQVLNVTHPAGATVAASGGTVTITPAHDATGTVAMVATVTDVAGRPDRSISVAITATVIGFPGMPGAPTVKVSSHTLQVTFGTAAPNGAPVEYYTVYANGAPHQCASSPCDVTGLSNGTSYTVYVTATNSVGQSKQSGTTTGQPNAVPDQVTGLATDVGDGQVTLTWQPARVDGTPVTGYNVEISPPPGGQQQIQSVGVTTSHAFTGLVNGTTYTFTVMAVNAEGNGPWSVGVTAVPFGKPLTMAAPAATGAPVPDPTTTRAIQVTWAAVQGTAANGRPVTSYTINEYSSSSSGGPWTQVSTSTVDGSTTTTSFTVTNDSSWYEYTVTATNLAGASPPSPQSSPAVQAAAPPNAPTNVTATATGQSNTISVSFTVPAANAKQIKDVEYGVNASSETGTINGPFTTGGTATFTLTSALSSQIANGKAVTVYLAACNDASLCSAWAGPTAQVTPYQPIATPTVTAAASGTSIAYTWKAASDGLAETLNVCINSGCTNYSVPATGGYSGSSTVNAGYSTKGTITAYLTDTKGQRAPASGTVTASATTAAPPNPTVSVAKGNVEQAGKGSCVQLNNCYNFYVTVTNFPAGATLTAACADNSGVFSTSDLSWSGSTVTASSSGGASWYTQCQHAPDGETVTITVTGGGKSGSGSYKT